MLLLTTSGLTTFGIKSFGPRTTHQLLHWSFVFSRLLHQNHLEHVFIGREASRWQSILLLQPQEVEAV